MQVSATDSLKPNNITGDGSPNHLLIVGSSDAMCKTLCAVRVCATATCAIPSGILHSLRAYGNTCFVENFKAVLFLWVLDEVKFMRRMIRARTWKGCGTVLALTVGILLCNTKRVAAGKISELISNSHVTLRRCTLCEEGFLGRQYFRTERLRDMHMCKCFHFLINRPA